MNRAADVLSHLSGISDYSYDLDSSVVAGAVSSPRPEDVVIVSYARTPIGSLNGKLASMTASQLGGVAIKAALDRANVSPDSVDAVYMGNVLQANVGQAPARQAAIAGGITYKCPATTVNKVCASGMKAVTIAVSDLRLGHAKIAVAGGMESMTNAPHYLPKMRSGVRMGDSVVIDGMTKDGLTDPYDDVKMGVLAEQTAAKFGISKTEQDEYAKMSYERAVSSWKNGHIEREVVPVEIRHRSQTSTVKEDEQYSKMRISDIPTFKGVFGGAGTVTAANSSGISDGAAALVLTTRQIAKELGLKPLAVIRSWADAATTPEEFTIAPSLAIPIALKRANLDSSDIDIFEINEAFAVVSLVNMKLLSLDPSRVNVAGGAVSLGHPLGTSGARIICALLNSLESRKGRYGCAAICNGGGGASAIVIERI